MTESERQMMLQEKEHGPGKRKSKKNSARVWSYETERSSHRNSILDLYHAGFLDYFVFKRNQTELEWNTSQSLVAVVLLAPREVESPGSSHIVRDRCADFCSHSESRRRLACGKLKLLDQLFSP